MDSNNYLLIVLFNSILASIFWFDPLTENLNSKRNSFLILFFIRLIILHHGYFINPLIFIIGDILAIIIGSFENFPKKYNKKKNTDNIQNTKKRYTYNHYKKYTYLPKKITYTPYKKYTYPPKKITYKPKKKFAKIKYEYIPNKNVSNKTLEENGIVNPSMFKNELYELFIIYLKAYSNIDYNTLSYICTSLHFHIISNKLNYIEKTDEKYIYNNFIKNSVIIDDIDSYGYSQKISVIIDIDYDSLKIYSKDCNSKSHIHQKLNIIFVKNKKQIYNLKQCKNCGAPLNIFNLKCDYCGSIINTKINWRINSIKKIDENELNTNNFNQ